MTQGVVEIRGMNPLYNRYRYFINNFTGIDYTLDTATDAMPLPQANDEGNILTKTQGNSMRITITWVMATEDETVVLSNNVVDDQWTVSTGADLSDLKETNGDLKYPNGTVKTPDEQARFLLEDFQNSGVEFRYAIVVGDTKINKTGVIERVSMKKTGSTPVTYQASLTFLVGNVVTVTGSE